MMRRRKILGIVLGCGLLIGSAVPLAAERELVDRVVAYVDDDAILLSEVLQEMNMVRMQRNLRELTEADQAELFRDILEEMIADRLLVAQATQRGFEVSEQDLRDAVDDDIRTIKERVGGEERYREELARQGYTEVEVRDLRKEQARRRMLASRVLQTEVRRGITVSEAEVRSWYDTKRDSLPPELLRTPESLQLGHILIAPQADSSRVRAARAKIEAAAKRLAAGEEFAQVASEVSEWPTSRNGGLLGTFRYGDFESDEFDRAVAALEPGQTSGVIETRFGLQIVRLETRKGDEMTGRHIVVKMDPDQNAAVRALERALEVRRRIAKGESFESLAKAFSDDSNTRDAGGVVDGEWKRDELRPEFRAPLDSTAVGSVTSVVRTEAGFHLFKVITRTASSAASFEQVQPGLRRWLEQRAFENRYRTYLESLRKNFHVDVKA
jgi:peptidyl-prolyl cis-trans isomerase SurA